MLVDLDSAVNADESDRRMRRLGLEIEDEIRRIESEMKLARRKRSVAVSGAGVGTVAAVLVAIYGPALDAALALFGASAGAGDCGTSSKPTQTTVQQLSGRTVGITSGHSPRPAAVVGALHDPDRFRFAVLSAR
ncbi:hypothetical protein E4K10_47910 [Streptomyces sp. T1317-0309]|nr:hypothetical protein E4K10_47910 [Streptomyces sp. T1317-0309]